jgi:hypothetical protein
LKYTITSPLLSDAGVLLFSLDFSIGEYQPRAAGVCKVKVKVFMLDPQGGGV